MVLLSNQPTSGRVLFGRRLSLRQSKRRIGAIMRGRPGRVLYLASRGRHGVKGSFRVPERTAGMMEKGMQELVQADDRSVSRLALPCWILLLIGELQYFS